MKSTAKTVMFFVLFAIIFPIILIVFDHATVFMYSLQHPSIKPFATPAFDPQAFKANVEYIRQNLYWTNLIIVLAFSSLAAFLTSFASASLTEAASRIAFKRA